MADFPLIFSALAAVMADIPCVPKNDRNDHQKFNFRGIDAVTNAVGPALRRQSVIVVPDVESVTYEVVQTTTGKPSTACRVIVSYRFFASDGSSVSARVAGEAWDSGDKAAPKAMSVAMRTALIQALALPTDEPDPDHDTYERSPEPPLVSDGIAHEFAEAVNGLGKEGRRAWLDQFGVPPDRLPADRIGEARQLLDGLEAKP